MKKIDLKIAIAAVIIAMFAGVSYSRTINISASDFQFSPSTISDAVVGDTIKWNWVNGGHTTTCNGSSGTSRPAGADPWDENLNSGNPTFLYVITIQGTYNYVCTPHSPSMAGTIIASPSSITQLNEIAASYKLSQNFPNPFNPSTKINFSIPVSSNVFLKIYNSIGQEVATLVNERMNSGSYRVDWNAINYSSGVYYYKIVAGDFVETRKMFLMR